MTVPLLFVATAILVVAEPSKQGCAKTGYDHVMLQKSISTKSTAVAKESPIGATASPAESPPDPPESHVAVRLQRRLASDPHAVHRAADAIGAELKPEHHAHLEALRSKPTVAMLKTGSAQPQPPPTTSAMPSGSGTEQIMTDLIRQFRPYAAQRAFYDDITDYTVSQFDQLIASGADGTDAPATQFTTKMDSLISRVEDLIFPGLSAASALTLAAVPRFESTYDSRREGLFDHGLQEDFKAELERLSTETMGDVKTVLKEGWESMISSHEFWADEALLVREEFLVLVEHLKFLPNMLSQQLVGAAAGFESQIMLMWLLTVNHDIETLGARLLGGGKCFPVTVPPREDCTNWHKHCPALEALDLMLLHTQVTLAMAMLEPSWAVPLRRKMQSGLADSLQVVSMAKWACMTNHGKAFIRGSQIHSRVEYKMRALLKIQGSYDEYLSFRIAFTGLQTHTANPQPGESRSSPGIVQGILFDKDGRAEGLAYYTFKYWQPGRRLLVSLPPFNPYGGPPPPDPAEVTPASSSLNGWLLPNATQNLPNLTHVPVEAQEYGKEEKHPLKIRVETSMWANVYVFMRSCPPLSFLHSLGNPWEPETCLQPGAWTTADCVGREDDSQYMDRETCWGPGGSSNPPCGPVTLQGGSDQWVGCPAGMYVGGWTDKTPCHLECRCLRGEGAKDEPQEEAWSSCCGPQELSSHSKLLRKDDTGSQWQMSSGTA